jgi:hypothetical protein
MRGFVITLAFSSVAITVPEDAAFSQQPTTASPPAAEAASCAGDADPPISGACS